MQEIFLGFNEVVGDIVCVNRRGEIENVRLEEDSIPRLFRGKGVVDIRSKLDCEGLLLDLRSTADKA